MYLNLDCYIPQKDMEKSSNYSFEQLSTLLFPSLSKETELST
jgi:hypothetical protein